MKTARTMEEARRLKIGETARFKIPTRSVIVDDFACPACGVSFSMEETPRFCPRCGARWNIRLRRMSPGFFGTRGNGKSPVVAVEE